MDFLPGETYTIRPLFVIRLFKEFSIGQWCPAFETGESFFRECQMMIIFDPSFWRNNGPSH